VLELQDKLIRSYNPPTDDDCKELHQLKSELSLTTASQNGGGVDDLVEEEEEEEEEDTKLPAYDEHVPDVPNPNHRDDGDDGDDSGSNYTRSGLLVDNTVVDTKNNCQREPGDKDTTEEKGAAAGETGGNHHKNNLMKRGDVNVDLNERIKFGMWSDCVSMHVMQQWSVANGHNWSELVDEVSEWIGDLLRNGFEDIEDRSSPDIKLPLNIGMPHNSFPMFNISQFAAMRVYFSVLSDTVDTRRTQTPDDVMFMHAWAKGSGNTTVGVLPSHYKTYPMEQVSVLTKLVDFVNEYFSSNAENWNIKTTTVNHIELKIYFGKDVLLGLKLPRFGKPGVGDSNRRQMSTVRDHCDWTISELSDDLTGNVIGTLSLGATRLMEYRTMRGKKIVDGIFQQVPLSHGSFNLLFKEDEKTMQDTTDSITTTVRIKHRVIHTQNPELGCDGNGISVGIVLRSCNNIRAFHGPTTLTPYAIVTTEEELNHVNKPRIYTTRGNNGSSITSRGSLSEHANSIIIQQASGLRKFVQGELEPCIRHYLDSQTTPFSQKIVLE
jgi:hypothetical protein